MTEISVLAWSTFGALALASVLLYAWPAPRARRVAAPTVPLAVAAGSRDRPPQLALPERAAAPTPPAPLWLPPISPAWPVPGVDAAPLASLLEPTSPLAMGPLGTGEPFGDEIIEGLALLEALANGANPSQPTG
jgi:hypothetical protein